MIRRQELLIEAYDAAAVRLQQVTAQLLQAQAEMRKVRAIAAAAHSRLNQAARTAYESQGSAIAAFLGATSFADASDQLQFLQDIAQQNTDVATTAKVAEQRAREAAQRFGAALRQRRRALATLAAKRTLVVASIAKQRSMIASIQRQLRAAHRRALQLANLFGSAPPGTGGGTRLPSGLPPPPNPQAATAIAAARSVLGVPYVWGAANPSVGFDCSGLTMWAWAHAGVSLPHFAAAQYAMLPKVPQDQLEPGDLVFFDALGHVGLYIGNGMMIDAPYPGTVVRVDPVWWAAYVGAARP